MSAAKKILSIVLILTLISSLVACGSKHKYTSDTGRRAAAQAADILEAYLDGTIDASTAKIRLDRKENYLRSIIQEVEDNNEHYEYFYDHTIVTNIFIASSALSRQEPKSKIEEHMKELRKYSK